MIVNANGVDLWVEQEGAGDDVLFISGLADEGACWVDQVGGLSDRYRVTTFDNRGVGRSTTPEGEFTIADFAADTAALMDALEIESAHVVGSSMGGAIAQELALAHPERVRSLVLNGTWCRGDRFLHEIFRNWMWSAEKADSIRDFLVTVNLWCFSPRIWNEGDDGRMGRSSRGQPVRPVRRRVLPIDGGPDRSRHRGPGRRDFGTRRSSRSASSTWSCRRASRRSSRAHPERPPGRDSRTSDTSPSRSFRPTTTPPRRLLAVGRLTASATNPPGDARDR